MAILVPYLFVLMQLFRNKEHLNTRITDWIEGARNGDPRSQKSIYDALSGKMFAVCLRYMGNRDDALDVLQDGFVALFSKIGTYSGDGSFEGWCRRIFVNTALMSLRKKDVLRQSQEVETAFNVSNGAPTAIQDLSCSEIMKYVSELPPGFRTVFNMYAVEGYSHKEIAQALDITESTSRSQFLRARAILQTKIEEKY